MLRIPYHFFSTCWCIVQKHIVTLQKFFQAPFWSLCTNSKSPMSYREEITVSINRKMKSFVLEFCGKFLMKTFCLLFLYPCVCGCVYVCVCVCGCVWVCIMFIYSISISQGIIQKFNLSICSHVSITLWYELCSWGVEPISLHCKPLSPLPFCCMPFQIHLYEAPFC